MLFDKYVNNLNAHIIPYVANDITSTVETLGANLRLQTPHTHTHTQKRVKVLGQQQR